MVQNTNSRRSVFEEAAAIAVVSIVLIFGMALWCFWHFYVKWMENWQYSFQAVEARRRARQQVAQRRATELREASRSRAAGAEEESLSEVKARVSQHFKLQTVGGIPPPPPALYESMSIHLPQIFGEGGVGGGGGGDGSAAAAGNAQPIGNNNGPQMDEEGGAGDCSICLEGYLAGDVTGTSQICSHMFHEVCILEWIKCHDTCPLCRTTLT